MLKTTLLTIGALCAVALFAQYQQREQSLPPPPRAALKDHTPQAQCASALWREKTEAKVATVKGKTVTEVAADLSADTIDRVFAERRENERYCLRYAACFVDPSQTPLYATFVRACLTDEEADEADQSDNSEQEQ